MSNLSEPIKSEKDVSGSDLTTYIANKTNTSIDRIEMLTQRLSGSSNTSLVSDDSRPAQNNFGFPPLEKEHNIITTSMNSKETPSKGSVKEELPKKCKRKSNTPERYPYGSEKKIKSEVEEKKVMLKKESNDGIESMKIERFLTQTSPTKPSNISTKNVIKTPQKIQPINPSIQQLSSQNNNLNNNNNNLNIQNIKKVEEYEQTINILKNEIVELNRKNDEIFRIREEHKKSLIEIITKLSIDRCSLKRKLNSEKSYIYGYQTYVRRVQNVEDIWVEGEEYKELVSEENRLNVIKDQRKSKKKKNVGNESEELCKIMNKKLSNELQNRQRNYNICKCLHQRESKRILNEDSSRFNNHPVLHDQYLLMELLGKGGFSEVWKAFDLENEIEVACKIHQLNSTWSEGRKQNYIKHATREYAINRSVNHENIIKFLDVFEIDSNAFATVLEYCNGTDLEKYLEQNDSLNEKEAYLILCQVVNALYYLNTGVEANPLTGETPKIIHYDLKPANILMNENGVCKVTDFGLSKIVSGENDGNSLELTSPGAGTYWYLPPECFYGGVGNIGLIDNNNNNNNKSNNNNNNSLPRISNKVDVWSLGVIYYEMIYGKRPFGDGISQDAIYQNKTIINSSSNLKLPNKPSLSELGKEFIIKCLTPNQELRPDVIQIYNDAYLPFNKK